MIYARNLLKFVLFADRFSVASDTLNRELAKLFVWFSINKLSLNLGKTNYTISK